MSEDEEDARWAIAYAMAHELAVEAGVTEEDLAWARSVLGLDLHEDLG
jgi:hypothetical protein